MLFSDLREATVFFLLIQYKLDAPVNVLSVNCDKLWGESHWLDDERREPDAALAAPVTGAPDAVREVGVPVRHLPLVTCNRPYTTYLRDVFNAWIFTYNVAPEQIILNWVRVVKVAAFNNKITINVKCRKYKFNMAQTVWISVIWF